MSNATIEKEVIGVWGITNTIAVELIDIEYGVEDVATVRLPDGEITEASISYDAGVEDESTASIMVDEMQLYFDECIRV